MTIIGSAYNVCAGDFKPVSGVNKTALMNCSKNFILTVGDGTGSSVLSNTEVGRYMTTDDRYGKEFIVKTFGQSVAVWKDDDGFDLSFRGILMTTTTTDCKGAFDWSGSETNWMLRIRLSSITQVISGLVSATISDCAISYSASLANGSPLPTFISYNKQTKMLALTVV